MQYTYHVKLKRHFTDEEMQEWGITMEELRDLNNYGYMPMTNSTAAALKQRSDIVESITLNKDASDLDIYPLNGNMHWTRADIEEPSHLRASYPYL